MRSMITHLPTRQIDKMAPVHLSKREKEVLGLLAQGFSAREVSEELHRSIRTIQFHAANILIKTETSSVIAAIAIAMHQGHICAPTAVARRRS